MGDLVQVNIVGGASRQRRTHWLDRKSCQEVVVIVAGNWHGNGIWWRRW
jgi:hypothetical protein